MMVNNATFVGFRGAHDWICPCHLLEFRIFSAFAIEVYVTMMLH